MPDTTHLTIGRIKEGLQKKEFSVAELVQGYLDEIEKQADLNAFITVDNEGALKKAKDVDERIATGQPLLALEGVPCSLKDAILAEGLRCTAGSRILEPYVAAYDATVVRKLKEAGAVILGKTNMDDCGMGTSTENSAFGVTKNPHDASRVAGGSSGGSAAAVASHLSSFSLGEDTGGSIRLPASFCGVVGMKPTYGAVSRHGIIALASSLDQVGPFANTVEDVQAVFNVISGKDPLDSTSVEFSQYTQISKFEIRKVKIGVPKEYFSEGLQEAVKQQIELALKKFEDAGAKLVEISVPHMKQALAVYYIINMSEASSNLARYDGIRYGLSKKKETLLDTYLESRGEGFGREVKRRILLGTYALSAGYYEAYYVKAQKIRTLLKQDFEKAFERVDVIMGPVTPFPAFPIGEKTENPLEMYLADVYTVPVNLAGLPALSVPAGLADGLPVGLHMIGKAFDETFLFEVGKLYEKIQ